MQSAASQNSNNILKQVSIHNVTYKSGYFVQAKLTIEIKSDNGYNYKVVDNYPFNKGTVYTIAGSGDL